jgi:hypothetical protein
MMAVLAPTVRTSQDWAAHAVFGWLIVPRAAQ